MRGVATRSNRHPRRRTPIGAEDAADHRHPARRRGFGYLPRAGRRPARPGSPVRSRVRPSSPANGSTSRRRWRWRRGPARSSIRIGACGRAWYAGPPGPWPRPRRRAPRRRPVEPRRRSRPAWWNRTGGARRTPGPSGAPAGRPAPCPTARCRAGPGRGGASPAPDQPAAERPAGPSQPPCRLVGREPLEVAEHDRQPEGPGQALDLAVQRLGLLGVDHRFGCHGGSRLRTIDGPGLLVPAPSGDPHPGLAGGAQRHAIKPVAQPLRLARPSQPSGPGRGRRPEKRRRPRGRRRGAGGRRPAPSARAVPPARRKRPRRARPRTARGAVGRVARRPSRPRRATRAAGPVMVMPRRPCLIALPDLVGWAVPTDEGLRRWAQPTLRDRARRGLIPRCLCCPADAHCVPGCGRNPARIQNP